MRDRKSTGVDFLFLKMGFNNGVLHIDVNF